MLGYVGRQQFDTAVVAELVKQALAGRGTSRYIAGRPSTYLEEV